MSHIQSETGFLLGSLWRFLVWPYRILLVLFGKAPVFDLFYPFPYFFHYIVEARLTLLLLIVNVLVYYGLTISLNVNYLSSAVLEQYIFHPWDLINGNFISLFSSMFLHASQAHLWGNMIGLFIFGRVVERRLGPFKMLFLYIGAGILAAIAHMMLYIVLGNNIGALGASGAIMGLVSAAVLLDPFYITYELVLPLPIMVLGWIMIFTDVVGLLSPEQTGIGHIAHLGGYIGIFLLMKALPLRDNQLMETGFLINGITFLLSLGIGVIVFFL